MKYKIQGSFFCFIRKILQYLKLIWKPSLTQIIREIKSFENSTRHIAAAYYCNKFFFCPGLIDATVFINPDKWAGILNSRIPFFKRQSKTAGQCKTAQI